MMKFRNRLTLTVRYPNGATSVHHGRNALATVSSSSGAARFMDRLVGTGDPLGSSSVLDVLTASAGAITGLGNLAVAEAYPQMTADVVGNDLFFQFPFTGPSALTTQENPYLILKDGTGAVSSDAWFQDRLDNLLPAVPDIQAGSLYTVSWRVSLQITPTLTHVGHLEGVRQALGIPTTTDWIRTYRRLYTSRLGNVGFVDDLSKVQGRFATAKLLFARISQTILGASDFEDRVSDVDGIGAGGFSTAGSIDSIPIAASGGEIAVGPYTYPSVGGDGQSGKQRWYALFLESVNSSDPDALVDIAPVLVDGSARFSDARGETPDQKITISVA